MSRKQNGSSLVVTGSGRGVERKLVIHGYTLPSPLPRYILRVLRNPCSCTNSRRVRRLVISFPRAAHRRPSSSCPSLKKKDRMDSRESVRFYGYASLCPFCVGLCERASTRPRACNSRRYRHGAACGRNGRDRGII